MTNSIPTGRSQTGLAASGLFGDFSHSASAAMPGDNRRMAATAEEGTAHKLVTCKCGRTMPNSEERGDSRKDGA